MVSRWKGKDGVLWDKSGIVSYISADCDCSKVNWQEALLYRQDWSLSLLSFGVAIAVYSGRSMLQPRAASSMVVVSRGDMAQKSPMTAK
jgi:hypothetical protein